MKPARLLPRTITVVAIALLMLASSTVDEGTMAETVTKFADGSSDMVLTLSQGGQNTDASFLVPVDGIVTEASFAVTGMDAGTYVYPNRVQVHLGSIGARVYVWAGRFYSPMGFQDRFTDQSDAFDHTYEDIGFENTHSVRLPAGAKITSAQLRVEGFDYDAGWDYPVKLSHKVGNNVVPINTGGRPAPQLIDYDSDGDLDMLTGGYQYNSGNYKFIFLYENVGNKTVPKWQEDEGYIDISYDYSFVYSVPRLVDLDGDDDNDLVLGLYSGGMVVYWNTGSNASPNWTADSSGSDAVFYGIDEGYYAVPDFADMDNDGDLDLAYGKYGTGGSSVAVSSYENRYANGEWSWSSASFFDGSFTDTYSAPCVVDYDGDGDYDLFVGNYNGTVLYFENTGSKSSPKYTYVPKVGKGIDIGTMARPALADIDDDGDLDMVVGAYDGAYYLFKKVLSSPTDLKIDVGDDGDTDWKYKGELTSSAIASGLAAEFESHLTGSYSEQDEWGNRFHDVPINFTSSSAGKLRVDQLRVVFEYTAKTIDFTAILNEYIKDHKGQANDEGYLEVPIIVTSGSNGKLKLSNLKVVVDRVPKISQIPSTFAIDEDTKNLHLIDLTQYVSDDITAFGDLTITVIQHDQVGIVNVSMQDGRYVGADAETGTANDNWFGKVQAQVKVVDGRGQSTLSNIFTIEVRPVNDAPVLDGLPPSELMEDEAFSYQLVAKDVDGDPLSYFLKDAPEGMKVSEAGVITWTPDNDDVGEYSVTITVTDPNGGSVTADWPFRVINVNDPPTLTLPEFLIITEGKEETFDLSGMYYDVDNPKDSLVLTVDNPYSKFDAGSQTVLIYYPKETGIEEDRLVVTVVDPEGMTATGVIILRIQLVDKLSLSGIPDQTAVETVPLIVDIKPYLYNVEDWGKLTISESSAFCTVSGTRLTFLYTEGAMEPADTESVVVTARQGEEMASDTIAVHIKRLGADLALGIIPDQDVLENEEYTLDITPYILKAPDIDAVEVEVSASENVKLAGRVLVFNYPMYYGPETETVTVSITYKEFGDSASFNVRILNAEDDFVLLAIPDVTVTETVPESFNIKQYIKNADDIDRIKAHTDSAYADVNKFDVQLTYPAGFTGEDKVRDDIVRVTITDGIRSYTRPVTVHVNRLGKTLHMSGIGDRTVYVGDDLVIDLELFLYNVDDLGDVVAEVDPATYVVQDGLVFTFNFPAIVSFPSQRVTFKAYEGSDLAEETITIYIEQLPVEFTFGPIGSITVKEGVAYKLDVRTYLKNMDTTASYELGVHSDHATVDGFTITFLYDVEDAMTELVRVNVTGSNDDFAEQDVYVIVKAVNDPPEMVKPFPNSYDVVEGEPALVIDLASHFSDIDTARLHFMCSADVVTIDNENGTATLVFPKGAARPDDVTGVVFHAYDPDDPSSETVSNAFDIAFYPEGEEPGPGPVTPGIQDPSGGSGWVVIVLLVLVAAAGAGWMWYRKRKPAIGQ